MASTSRRGRRGADMAGRGHTPGRGPRGGRSHPQEEGGSRRPGGCPGTPRHPAAVRHDPVGQGLDGHLDAPLEKWRVFLHPSQEKLVAKKFNGPARVLGGAGTGKTVVAMHRARHLASRSSPLRATASCSRPSRRIWLRTSRKCSRRSARSAVRIEVVHLHAWAVRFLRATVSR